MMNSFFSASTVLRKFPRTLTLNSLTEYTVGLISRFRVFYGWGAQDQKQTNIQGAIWWTLSLLTKSKVQATTFIVQACVSRAAPGPELRVPLRRRPTSR